MKSLIYGIDSEGLVVSCLRIYGHTEGFAVPVLEFDGMGPWNGFAATFDMTRFNRLDFHYLNQLGFTKKISRPWKNIHRKFWGFELLKMDRKDASTFKKLLLAVRVPEQRPDVTFLVNQPFNVIKNVEGVPSMSLRSGSRKGSIWLGRMCKEGLLTKSDDVFAAAVEDGWRAIYRMRGKGVIVQRRREDS